MNKGLLLNLVTLGMSAISIYGAWLNAKAKISGFYVWIVANCLWIIYSLATAQYGQVPLWVIYTLISLNGIREWKKKKYHEWVEDMEKRHKGEK